MSSHKRVRVLLTKEEVDGLTSDRYDGRRFYDADLTGFGVRVYSSGRKVFFIEYGQKGRRRLMTIGEYGRLTFKEARDAARKRLATATLGGDPLGEREAARAMPTADQWFASYLAGEEGRRKSMAVARCYLSWASDRWHNRPLDEITPRDVEAAVQFRAQRRTAPAKWRKGAAPGHVARTKRKASPATRTVGGRPGAARWLQYIASAFQAAVRAGIIRENPCRHVKKFPANPPRQRVLTDEEMGRLLAAVDRLPEVERGIFRLLVETGCRRSEALGARWENFDFAAGVWTLRSTKAGVAQSMPLAGATVVMLRALPRHGPFVFASPRRPGEPVSDLRPAWRRLKAAAALPADVNVHDIRRSYGLAVARKAGILAASKLLRHSNINVTAKIYAPLAAEELRKVADDIADDRGKLLPFPPAAEGSNGQS